MTSKDPCRRASVECGWKERLAGLLWCKPDVGGAVSGLPHPKERDCRLRSLDHEPEHLLTSVIQFNCS